MAGTSSAPLCPFHRGRLRLRQKGFVCSRSHSHERQSWDSSLTPESISSPSANSPSPNSPFPGQGPRVLQSSQLIPRDAGEIPALVLILTPWPQREPRQRGGGGA